MRKRAVFSRTVAELGCLCNYVVEHSRDMMRQVLCPGFSVLLLSRLFHGFDGCFVKRACFVFHKLFHHGVSVLLFSRLFAASTVALLKGDPQSFVL